MRNNFCEMLRAKYGRETSPRPFLKKSKLSISLDKLFEVSYSLFLFYVHVEDYQNIETDVLNTCLFFI